MIYIVIYQTYLIIPKFLITLFLIRNYKYYYSQLLFIQMELSKMNGDYIQSMLESKDFDFENENLASFDFSGRDLRCANFKNANLYNANFSGCDLRRAVFKDAYVTDANFKNAILLGVDFTECNIEDAIV